MIQCEFPVPRTGTPINLVIGVRNYGLKKEDNLGLIKLKIILEPKQIKNWREFNKPSLKRKEKQ